MVLFVLVLNLLYKCRCFGKFVFLGGVESLFEYWNEDGFLWVYVWYYNRVEIRLCCGMIIVVMEM